MAGETEQQVAEQTEEQAAESFAAGFEDVAPQVRPATEQTAGQEGQEGNEPGATEQPADEIVQVKKADWDRVLAAAEKAETIDGQMSKVFGTIGNVKNEMMTRLQGLAPAGAAITISDDDFAELAADFPELAGHTKTAIERIIAKGGLRGTGDPAPAQVDQAQLRKERMDEELAELNFIRPDWKEVVGFNADGSADPNSEYRKWLAEQPETYRNTVSNTLSARITERSISKFLEVKAGKTAKPPTISQNPRDDARRERIAAAVQPTGRGERPAPARATPEDEFRAGFASG